MFGLTDKLLTLSGVRGGGDPKARVLRLALRAFRLRRRLQLGDYAYATISSTGGSFSLKPFKGVTVLIKPGKTPMVTITLPRLGTHRYSLPGPRLTKISWGALRDAVDVAEFGDLAVTTMDRVFPGIDPPKITIVANRIAQIAKFEVEPKERIAVSRSLMKRIGRTATEDAVRRECIRAGVWERHGVIQGELFEEAMRRAGERSVRAQLRD